MWVVVEGQIEVELLLLVLFGMFYDDGVIDLCDICIVLGMCLFVIVNGLIKGMLNFGVFWM